MRYTPVFVAGLLFLSRFSVARPFMDDSTGASSDSGPPSGFEWKYEGLAALVYFGLIAATAALPEKARRVAMPIAWLWPVLFWLGFMVFKG